MVATTHADALKALAEGDTALSQRRDGVRPGRPGAHVPARATASRGDRTPWTSPREWDCPTRCWHGRASWRAGPRWRLEEVIATLEAREAALARETERLAERAAWSWRRRPRTSAPPREALDRREHELAVHSRAAIEAAVREARDAIRAIVQTGAGGGFGARGRGGAGGAGRRR